MASTPGQDLAERFERSGVQVSVGAGRLALRLTAVGYGSALRKVPAVAPRTSANRVTYALPGLSEWYANGPFGLEQGFTLARAPRGADTKTLTLALALATNMRVTLSADRRGLAFSGPKGASLRYDGLLASDARGRVLTSWLTLERGRLLVHVNARGARYPLRIDPLVQQGEKLTGSEEVGDGDLGTSVAISSGGTTALVGAPDDSGGLGGAWVFVRTGQTWTQQAKLTGAETSGEAHFGSAVALSSNGSTAIVGGSGDSSGAGAVWMFTRSGSSWSQQGGKLTPKEGEEVGAGAFGASVAVSGEGNVALVGAPGDNGGIGALWAFTCDEGSWSQQGGKLTPKEGEEVGAGAFGASVAVSGEGNVALVGAPGDDSGVGAAWTFQLAEGAWSQQGEKLTATLDGEIGAGAFGASVALSGDASSALIGAPHSSEESGAAWAFTRSGTEWTLPEELTGNGESGKGQLGASAALSSTGSIALIGAPNDSSGAGAAWTFVRSGAGWGQTGEALTGEGASGEGQFGTSVALNAAGTGALVGAPNDGGGIGAAYAFANPPIASTGAATSITQTGASLNATVNPNGAEVTSCLFEYGTDEHYGSSVPCSSLPGSGTEPVPVAATLEDLAADTTYHFRVVATGPGGTDVGLDASFQTLPNAPSVIAGAASAITQRTALLRATVNPNGGDVTACRFEYGPSASYGSSLPCEGTPGSGTTPVEVTAAAGELLPNTSYHFRIVATNAGGTSEAIGQVFQTLPQAPTVVTDAASAVGTTTATLNGSVDPNGGEVTSCRFEYGPTTAYGSDAPCSPTPGSGSSPVAVSAVVKGLSPDTIYHFRVVASNAGGSNAGNDESLETLPNPPTVTTGKASAVTQTTATLNATVDPNGGAVSECRFEYGPTSAYGLSVPCEQKVGSGTTPVAVSASISGLSANAGYHFRVVAANAGGAGLGGDQTFTTLPNPPTLEAGAASSVTQTSATLNATVNPNGGSSECYFEYGPTSSYGHIAACSPSPGSGTSPVAVSASIGGLSANSTYHFRLVASNPGGASKTADQTFTTLPNPPTVTTGKASAVTQTTATLNATVDPNGGEVSECRFEYGSTTAYEHSVSCSPSPGSGTAPVAVAASISGLSADSGYHFRVVAVNAGGASLGADEAFSTLPDPPSLEAGVPSSVTQTSAMLHGVVDPHGGEVSECRFEYGPTSSYGHIAACSPSPGSGASPVAVSASISGLSANSTYHFRLVASNPGGASKTADQTFTTLPNPPTVTTGKASAVTQTTATLNATVDPNGGEVSECRFEYGSTTAYEHSVSCSPSPGSGTAPVAVAASISDLSADSGYHFRVVAVNAGGASLGADEAFSTLPDPPSLEAGVPSSVTQTSAMLHGVVDPHGGEVSECRFEYGPTNSYGHIAACSPSPGSGTSPVAVSASISGLSANSTYHFRLVASNPGGASKTADQTFTTLPNPPTVETQPATAIAQTRVTLNGVVDPNGGSVTSCEFEYGTSVAYGSSAPCTPEPGAGNGPVGVSATVSGLSANTTYHFRVVAVNAGGESEGHDETLTTLPNAPAVVTEEGYSQGPTSETLTATVNPNGGNVTGCEFEWGSTNALGKAAPCSSAPGAGSKPVQVSAIVTGLLANTEYHFRIVASNIGGASDGSEQVFITAPGRPVVTLGKPKSIGQTFASLTGTVNPLGGVMLRCEFLYGPTESLGFETPCASVGDSGDTPIEVSAIAEGQNMEGENAEGLKADTRYYFTILTENTYGEANLPVEPLGEFTTLPGPSAITRPASSQTQTTATLNATVDPNGGEVDNCLFEYGPTEAYGHDVPCSPKPSSGMSPVAVSANVDGLSANSTYHFRVVAAVSSALVGEGKDESFKTLPNAPIVVTSQASSLTESSAVLNATVDPNGGEVGAGKCRFEYGPTAAYGASVPCAKPPGSGSVAEAVSAAVSNLDASSTYHFRVAAESAGGLSVGADRTLTTAATPMPQPAAPNGSTTPSTGVASFTSSGGGSTPVAPCRVSLASTKIALARATGVVSIKLLRAAAEASTCSGKLTLTAKVRGASAKARSKPMVLASGSFDVAHTGICVVKLELGKLARALVRQDHGQLAATLAIFNAAPGPLQTKTEAVHIAVEAASRSKGKQ